MVFVFCKSLSFFPNFITRINYFKFEKILFLEILLFCFFSRVIKVMVNDGEIFPSVFIIGSLVIVNTRILDFNDDFIVLRPSFFSF
jgi:hypothetical protein